MTNVKQFIQMLKEASRVYMNQDMDRGIALNRAARNFAEETFSENDFNEYIAICYGQERAVTIRWKNKVLAERKQKTEKMDMIKQQLGFQQ